MSASVVVMAHEARRQWVDGYLRPQLDLEPGQVVWDQFNDRHETGLRCLKAFDPGEPWHVIVQDDVLVCRDLIKGVHRALARVDEQPVGLFTGRARNPHGERFVRSVRLARSRGHAWLQVPGQIWGQVICLPTSQIPDLVRSYEASDLENYDRRIGRFYRREKIATLHTVPSLVDHRDGDENPSLVPERGNRGRTAAYFIGATRSALGVNWDTGVTRLLGEGETAGPARRRRRAHDRYA